MEKTLHEPARKLPVSGAFDVVIAGGGIAGVAAAVAAARTGASVGLLEKELGLGGLATLGNVTVWLPLCDGRGRQVIGGIAEELLRLSVRGLSQPNPEAGFAGVPPCWEPGGDPAARRTTRFITKFNPAAYLLDLESWVLEAGVSLLYDTRVCAVKRRVDRITHLIVENKSGRSAIACRAVVDASGDADVCFLAGETTESLDSNVAAAWFYYLKDGVAHLRPSTNPMSSKLITAELTCRGYRGDDAASVTAQLLESRALIRRETARLAEEAPGCDIQPFALPSIPCFRATRRLVGARSLSESHMHTWFDDAVCLTGDWRHCGPVFAITPDMLRGVVNRNLLGVGRCMSADTTIWDCTRVIPTCAVTGEAAGTAAAIACRDHAGDVHQVPAAALQTLLRERGNLIAPELVAPAADG
jgi:hypothetical protein